MAAKNTSTDNPAADSETPLEEQNHVVVPHQATPKTSEVAEEDTETMSFSDKAKQALTNKKFLAGVTSVALIAVGAFVVKKRNENTTTEDEPTSD